MTDQEFDVLDELYFLQSFDELSASVTMEEHELKNILRLLISKKWVKCQKSFSELLANDEINFENNYRIYYYLATKEGLLRHNSQ